MNTAARNQEIKYMEEISLNAWPSYRIELYDGWLLRYSHNYTYRTNSVEQIGESTISVSVKTYTGACTVRPISRSIRCWILPLTRFSKRGDI